MSSSIYIIDSSAVIVVLLDVAIITILFVMKTDKRQLFALSIYSILFFIVIDLLIFGFFYSIFNPILGNYSIIMFSLNLLALFVYVLLFADERLSKQFKIFKIRKLKKFHYIKGFLIIIILFSITFAAEKNWWYSIKVKAPDNFNTISSYWGPPRDDRTTVTRLISPLDNSTLHVNNATLNESVDNMGDGSFCYGITVKINGSDINYLNYSDGAESYPNGTIFLSKPLPTLNNIEITFVYRYDISVFKILGETNATLIPNYFNEHDDFINYTNIFMRIERTYLFQLFDWWNIKYYIDVGISSLSFPNIYNYKPFVERAKQLIEWAAHATYGKNGSKALTKMLGISADFEGGSASNPETQPLKNFENKPILILNEYENWLDVNEQNKTLYDEAITAWETVYSLGSSYGYKFYVVFQEDNMYDLIDGDLDYTRLPTYPISKNPDVIYGIMNYKNGKNQEDRFNMYKSSIDQIKIFGDQGKSELLGWISRDEGYSEYYTNDEQGLENYINDCLIAQAAGMEEIFHAPLYRLQAKWGNSAILKLHNALNNSTKREFTLYAKADSKFDQDPMYDALKDINHPSIAIGFYISSVIIASGLAYYNKKENLP